MAKNSLQKLLQVGIQFTEMSRKQAEAAVKQMVKAGAIRRSETEATVQAMIDRSRETAVAIGDSVQQEVARQLGWLAKRVDELEDQLESVVGRVDPSEGSVGAPPAASGAATSATATRPAAKKQRAATRKAPAATRKAPAATREAPAGRARKIAGSSG